MDNNILGGKLSIEDAFSSPLEKFISKIQTVENKYNTFANNIINGNRKIENSMNQTFNNLEKIANKFVANENKVANSINNANNKVKQNQEKTIDELIQRYGKLGEAIKSAYSSGDKVNPNVPKGQGSSGDSNSLKDFAQSFLQSGFAGVIGKLGPIALGVSAAATTMKAINNLMEQGFDVLNKVSDGLLSPEGIKDAVQESMGFETGRMKLNLFYGNETKGLDAYQTATYEANKTYASEKDTVDIMSKMGQMGVSVSAKQLEKLLDVAGTRDEVSTDHIGLAVKEALEGRVMMLQMYGINNRNLKNYYDGLRNSDPKEYKELKGALSKKGTADNPQKYVNLLTDYIEHSPMNNYAETYAKTLQGKLERMEGVWTKLKAEIMGIDTNTGIAKEGGVFSAIGKMVDKLGESLKDPTTVKSLETVGKAFGDAFTSIGNAFTKAVTPETIEKVAGAIAKIGEALAKMIEHFVDSGQLDKFLESFPSVADKVVKNKAIDVTTEAKTNLDLMQGDGFSWFKDWSKGKSDKINNMLGTNGDTIDINGGQMVNPYSKIMQDSTNSYDYLSNLNSNMLTDANVSTYIDRNINLTDYQKQSLKDYIKNDNASVYNNVTIGTIQANNYDEIMRSIEAAANNRR